MMMMGTTAYDDERVKQLPPGFLFSPTDEELVLHFLYSKASLLPCYPNIIPDLDLSLADPSQLNGKALSSGNHQYYFFSKAKEKRETENGYWKEIGESEDITSTSSAVEKKVGTKKKLVFHIGEAPHGIQTTWLMQQYHICNDNNIIATCNTGRRKHDDESWSKWVLCRVYEKKMSIRGVNYYSSDDDDHEEDEDDSRTELSWLDEVYLSLDDDLEEISMSILD